MVGREGCLMSWEKEGYGVERKRVGGEWEGVLVNMKEGWKEGMGDKGNGWLWGEFDGEGGRGGRDREFVLDELVKVV